MGFRGKIMDFDEFPDFPASAGKSGKHHPKLCASIVSTIRSESELRAIRSRPTLGCDCQALWIPALSTVSHSLGLDPWKSTATAIIRKRQHLTSRFTHADAHDDHSAPENVAHCWGSALLCSALLCSAGTWREH